MSAKLPKSSVRIRKDTPIAMATSVASFPVTPYHKEISSKSEKNEEQDEISIKRRTFDIFRRKVKTNLREKSTTQWNLPGLLKSTLPSMTKDVLVVCVFSKTIVAFISEFDQSLHGYIELHKAQFKFISINKSHAITYFLPIFEH